VLFGNALEDRIKAELVCTSVNLMMSNLQFYHAAKQEVLNKFGMSPDFNGYFNLPEKTAILPPGLELINTENPTTLLSFFYQ